MFYFNVGLLYLTSILSQETLRLESVKSEDDPYILLANYTPSGLGARLQNAGIEFYEHGEHFSSIAQ